MAKERENFGFYFSAHPVQAMWSRYRLRQWRTAPMLRLMEGGCACRWPRASAVDGGHGREGEHRHHTARQAHFVRADFSDQTGQFSAACFEEGLVDQLRSNGLSRFQTCVLLTMSNLIRHTPDEPPRVTVRSARPLSDVKGSKATACN